VSTRTTAAAQGRALAPTSSRSMSIAPLTVKLTVIRKPATTDW
jgi:hypothetical protein